MRDHGISAFDISTFPSVFLATKHVILEQNEKQTFPNPNQVFLVPKPVETISTGRLVEKQTASFNELKIPKVQQYKQ